MLENLTTWPWKAILTSGAVFTAVGSGAGYLLRRRIEKTGESEELDKLHRAVDLHKKLQDQQINIDDLREFRGRVAEKEVQAAANTAQYFLDRAERLASAPIEHEFADRGAGARPDGTQLEMNAYAAHQFEVAQTQLQELIDAKRSDMDSQMRAAFDESQAAWTAWRDREAQLEARVWEGGSIRPLMVASKQESLTRARIADLQLVGSLSEPTLKPRYPLTPRNVFDYVTPGVSAERVREILGTPHHADSWAWTYRYSEALLYIVLQEGSVRDVTLAMIEGQTLPIDFVHFDLELGRATFADLLAADPHANPHHRASARTNEIYATSRVGPSGAWQTFYFGALEPLGATGLLLPTTFDWDVDANSLVSRPSATLINWVGLSDQDEPPSFAWFITA